MAKKLTLLFARILLSAVFGFAAVTKIPDLTSTHLAVFQYHILSWELSEAFARFLPWLELSVALGLWIPQTRLGAPILSAFLSLLFLSALGSAMIRGLDITCGCFGASNAGVSLFPRILEDTVLFACSILMICEEALRSRGTLRLESQS